MPVMTDCTRLAAASSAFPILAQRINDHPLAYLDNAATTQTPFAVLDAMQNFECRDRANVHRGVHTLSQRATDALEQARTAVKRFVGAGKDHELVFTSGTTEALNLVASGMCCSVTGGSVILPGDEILVSGLEHHANLVPWQVAARRTGATLRILKPDADGHLHVEDLKALLTPRTRVFAITACANATGERPAYEEMLALATEAGALTVLDAAQAVGHEAMQLDRLACDFMVFSGHKMYGPMGTGVLVGGRAALDCLAPQRLGGDMVSLVSYTHAAFAPLPARLEGGTPNVSGAVGLAAACGFIEQVGRDVVARHIASLRAYCVAGLSNLSGVRVLSPEATATAIVSFVADGVHPHDIGTLLDERGIAVRTGHHCAQPLLEHLGCGSTTRASFALYNSHDEVDWLVASVARALETLR